MAGIDASAVLEVGGERCRIQRLDALEAQFGVSRLPYSLKVLLENLLRHNDGVSVSDDDIEALARWRGGREGGEEREIAFRPARVLMQDFTGVPAVVDLAAMRHAVAEHGGDPAALDP
ncbi:MAG: aconitate hydratase, partial [Limnobacter sp.]|nr:aconitate hydratase [Limnobacter sp.]